MILSMKGLYRHSTKMPEHSDAQFLEEVPQAATWEGGLCDGVQRIAVALAAPIRFFIWA